MICTPQSLVAGAECLDCGLNQKQIRAIRTYLLCQWAFAETCSGPLAPTTLTVLATTTSSITFSWAQPLSIPPVATGSYVIRWGSSAGNYNLGNVTVSSAPTAYTITGLSAGQTVYIIVQAIGTDGCPGGISAESAFTSQTDNALLNQLVALWTMDEDVASGTRVDVVGGNNLTDDNARIPAARGLMNGAALFVNGNSDSLSHADNADLGMGAGVSFTMVGWIMGSAVNTGWIGERSAGGTVDYVYSPQTGSWTVSDLGGVSRQVTVGTTNNNQWHMFAVGYDDATGLMWNQFDGGARSTLAISGVRKSGQPFRITMDFGNVDQVGLWKRSLTTADITTLFNSRRGNPHPFTATTTQILGNTWKWAVQHNGGAAPSVASTAAVGAYAFGLITDGLDGKYYSVVTMAPDSIAAALTPIVFNWQQGASYFIPYGADPWVNHNFVGGDLTVNGLKGDGSTKYIDTGLSANAILTKYNTGIFVYLYDTGVAASPLDFGAQDGGGNCFNMYPSSSGTSFLDNYSFVAGDGRISVATPGKGYYSGQSTSSTSEVLYFANSVNPHASIVSSAAGSSKVIPVLNPYLFTLNLSGAPLVAGFSDNTLSGAGIITGLSAAESALNFARVQTLRTAFGGGFR